VGEFIQVWLRLPYSVFASHPVNTGVNPVENDSMDTTLMGLRPLRIPRTTPCVRLIGRTASSLKSAPLYRRWRNNMISALASGDRRAKPRVFTFGPATNAIRPLLPWGREKFGQRGLFLDHAG